MTFPEEFTKDMTEAYSFWQKAEKDGNLVSLDQWVMMLVSKAIYEILRQKRVSAPSAKEKGRQEETVTS